MDVMNDVTVYKSRPRSTDSKTIQLDTGCGHLYVTLGRVDGKPFEVFAKLGHSGSCELALSEALCRSISIGLRAGVDINHYIKHLTGIQCPKPLPFPRDVKNLSCVDALAQGLRQLLDTYGMQDKIDTNDVNALKQSTRTNKQ